LPGAIFGHSGQAGADSITDLNLEWFSGNTEGRGEYADTAKCCKKVDLPYLRDILYSQVEVLRKSE